MLLVLFNCESWEKQKQCYKFPIIKQTDLLTQRIFELSGGRLALNLKPRSRYAPHDTYGAFQIHCPWHIVPNVLPPTFYLPKKIESWKQIFVFNCFWMNKNHIWERKVSCSNSLNQTATHRQQLCQLTPTQYASFDKSAGKQTTVSTTKAKDFSHEGASSVLDFTVMLQTLLQTVLMNKWMTEPETNSLWTKQNHYMVSWIIFNTFWAPVSF